VKPTVIQKVKIDTEYIALGQFLKLADVIQSGGVAKFFLQEYDVFINDEQDQRRGRKLRNGDEIRIPGFGEYVITN
jgi:ribosome-associated protein